MREKEEHLMEKDGGGIVANKEKTCSVKDWMFMAGIILLFITILVLSLIIIN